MYGRDSMNFRQRRRNRRAALQFKLNNLMDYFEKKAAFQKLIQQTKRRRR